MKLYQLLLGAAAALSLASCCGNSGSDCQSSSCDAATTCRKHDNCYGKAEYTGVLPAADAAGIRYTLKLDYANERGGEYSLRQEYIGAEVGGASYSDSEGTFTVHNGTPADGNAKFLKLKPKHPDRAEDNSSNVMYFVITSDSTITMTDKGLRLPDSGLNYTLTLKK